jgi:uncharacterized surface protein with fasciclin (FAS1) repeats
VKLKSGAHVTTVNGGKITVTRGPRGVRVNGARIVQTDISADNGVIHVIDEVLLPG